MTADRAAASADARNRATGAETATACRDHKGSSRRLATRLAFQDITVAGTTRPNGRVPCSTERRDDAWPADFRHAQNRAIRRMTKRHAQRLARLRQYV